MSPLVNPTKTRPSPMPTPGPGGTPLSASQALCSGKKGKTVRSSAAGAGEPRRAGVGWAETDAVTAASTVAASRRRTAVRAGWTTKNLGLDAHRPPDLVRSTGGTSI